MSVPSSCTALVIGGGPGGSYAAAALAREGVDCVLLEADKFPRYHIGESMLASIRYFLRFIDLEKRFDEYGFTKKLGAAFKYSVKREAYTDFVAVNGPNGYAWNFIRSESDMLMFNYAGEMGARTFDQTKVESIEFGAPLADFPNDPKIVNPGRPVSAKWSRKDGSSGTIKFDYLVDASGRNGLMSTKYLKNRKFNQALKNVAHWGYWKGAKPYAVGTDRENQPMNEALEDASGWVWAIPLHDGTLSVGIVVRQDLFFERKKARNLGSGAEFYKDYLKLAPTVLSLIEDAELMPELKTASDYSYNSPAYAGPNFRIVGDAGCFIDPYFSSGVHLAISSALSAAMTIQAVRRGDCDEITAARWHSSKVAEGYTRFLLIVMTAMLQIRRTEPVLSDFDEDGFDRAFGFFQPVIQGLADADVGGKLTDAKVSETVGFCLNAFNSITPAQRQAVLDKVQRVKANPNAETKEDLEQLDEEELKILQTIRARQMLRTEDTLHIDNFSQDAIDGYAPRLKHGALGLNKVASRAAPPEYTESLFDALEVRGQMGELVDSTLEVEA